MADFLIGYTETMKIEGGYANDKNDGGGETWKGVARKFHPSWLGWKIVDKIKRTNPGVSIEELNLLLGAIPELQKYVLSFYKVEFWDIVHGDEILEQKIANMLFDNAVNIGIPIAIEMAQNTAFNITGKDQAKELGIIYGRMDKKTLNKLNNVA